MTHAVIGQNEVHVPTHLFKCILVENKNEDDMAIGCFVVPNEPIDRNRPLTDFAMPIKGVEQKSGLELFRRRINLDDVPFLCNQTLCELAGRDPMAREFVEQVDYTRKIRRCTTRDQLRKVWTEIENKQYKTINKMLNAAYDKKLAEFDPQATVSFSRTD